MKNLLLGLLIFLTLITGAVPQKSAHASGYAPAYVTSVRLTYSGTNVGTSSWVQLIASLPSNCSMLDIFDSSGQTLELGVGAAGSEVRRRLITPGGNGAVRQYLSQDDRVAIRALSATANAGEIDITCLAD